jgi:hypothetical protein
MDTVARVGERTVALLSELQTEVGTRLRRGDSFELIEDEVIEPSALEEDEKSALWLFGWSCVETGRQPLFGAD